MTALRVAGCDPGTSSLHVLRLEDGRVPALALSQFPSGNLCVVELGSAFTACMVLRDGQVVDGVGGTAGPCGCQSGGGWDGEAAYLLSPLSKDDLFSGGWGGTDASGHLWF